MRSTDSGRGEAIARVLREHPPVLDDLTRARIEKRVLEGISAPRKARSRHPLRAGIALGVLAAAAALALFFASSDVPEPRVARFERREAAASVERGTLDAGSTVRTRADEVAEIQVSASRVRVEGASRVRLAALRDDQLTLELPEGSIEVAFHPRERGRERMSVETPTARVEVVGTVFRVEVRDGATVVSVSEGRVRVVALEQGRARLVSAGERLRVEAARMPEPVRVEAEAAPEPEPLYEDGLANEPEPRRADPEARLEQARALIDARRSSAAMTILRELTGAQVAARTRTEAWTLLAEVHAREGRHREARAAYERAATAGRGTLAGHNAILALARLEERQVGDRAAARQGYERYLSEAPGGPGARDARRALCRLGVADHCEEEQ